MRCLCAIARIVLLGAMSTASAASEVPLSSVEYMGQQIQLAKPYQDFRAYKNDRQNLNKQDIPKIERLIREARFGPEFSGTDVLGAALDLLRFPGYGSFYANQLGAHLDSKLELVYVEIPGLGLNRYIAVESQVGGRLRVVDDFVAPDSPEIIRVHRKNGALVYEAKQGVAVVPRRQ